MPARRLQFDRFVLDLDRGCLLHGTDEIALRPKTFALLQHLVKDGVLALDPADEITGAMLMVHAGKVVK